MAEATRYTITVGSNTNVTATTYELNDKQLKQLEALVGSGDISLDKTTGVITAKNAHGLVAASALMGVSFDELMKIEGLPAEINRGMMHESTMAAINRFSSSDPENMSLSELMTYMMMMVYQSESERREALQTAKGAQLLIQMEQARMAWAQSRESAERTFSYAMLSAIGTICSGLISAGMGIAGAGVQCKVSHYKKQIHKNKQAIQQPELDQQKQNDVAGMNSMMQSNNCNGNRVNNCAGKSNNNEVRGEEQEKSTVVDNLTQHRGDKNNINVDDLQAQNAKLEARIKELDPLVNGLQQAAVIGNVVSGGFQIGAAYAQKDAAFLQAEADLTRAFQSFSSAMVQNIDQSAQQALQQMEKLVSSLKEVFRAMYDIECSIARNI